MIGQFGAELNFQVQITFRGSILEPSNIFLAVKIIEMNNFEKRKKSFEQANYNKYLEVLKVDKCSNKQ